MSILKISHNAGFFSCCTIRLIEIIKFFNENKKLPSAVDSSEQFAYYKVKYGDITNLFFKNDNTTEIKYTEDVKITKSKFEEQFSDYKKINFDSINPFIGKYFTISDTVKNIVDGLVSKYKIDSNNTIAVFYRSNDKITETNIAPYEVFYKKLSDISMENPNMKILIQTDDQDFLDYCTTRIEDKNKIIVLDEIPRINKNSDIAVHHVVNQKDLFGVLFLAATKIVSMSKIIITHSGNCGMWSLFFRGNSDNVYQYLNPNKSIEDSYLKNSNLINDEELINVDNWLV
jgi:hypothetical protein